MQTIRLRCFHDEELSQVTPVFGGIKAEPYDNLNLLLNCGVAINCKPGLWSPESGVAWQIGVVSDGVRCGSVRSYAGEQPNESIYDIDIEYDETIFVVDTKGNGPYESVSDNLMEAAVFVSSLDEEERDTDSAAEIVMHVLRRLRATNQL